MESDEVQKAIKALGHDSFFVDEGGLKNLGVYEPTQVKSAIGNIFLDYLDPVKVNDDELGIGVDDALALVSAAIGDVHGAVHGELE